MEHEMIHEANPVIAEIVESRPATKPVTLTQIGANSYCLVDNNGVNFGSYTTFEEAHKALISLKVSKS